MTSNKLYIWLQFLGILFLCACSAVKYVPEEEHLLTRVEIVNSAKGITKEQYKPYIRQQPNNKIFGFWKFYLGLYNLSGRDAENGFNKWLRRIGEEPVLYDPFMEQRTNEQLALFLKNKGFFNATVTDSVIYGRKKRLKVRYTVNPGQRSFIKDLKYKIEDDSLVQPVLEDSLKTLLKGGRPFDVELHDRERERITRKLRNNGYYGFVKEYIWFLSDSTVGDHQITDTLVVSKQVVKGKAGEDSLVSHDKHYINKVFFHVNYDPGAIAEEDQYAELLDTMQHQCCYFLFKKKMAVNPSVLVHSNYIFPGDLYQEVLVQRTQNLLASLRLYKFINIRFYPVNDSVDTAKKLLNCHILLVPSEFQSYSVELEGNNSSGNLGAAGNLKYQHKNLFKGAEDFNLGFTAAMQNQSDVDNTGLNTLELGADASIEFPKFWMPFKLEGFRRRYKPKTSLGISYNYQRRPDYTRTIANARLGYSWQPYSRLSHFFSPISVNFVSLPTAKSSFLERIDGTFLEYSYKDHLIVNTNYSVVYNQQVLNQRMNFWYLRLGLEFAGNILDGVLQLTGTERNQEGYREFLGNRYAQYVKGDIDVRYNHFYGRKNAVAFRGFIGAGLPYGNLDVLPFEKQFFSGGANGVRAWPVRGLGPGSYSGDAAAIYNQTADVKVELNAEYRFKLFWLLEGAFFVDAGNIWTILDREELPNGVFKMDTFLSQMAVGTGLGTRIDLNYFIFRLDMGVKARDPALESGERWVFGSESLRWDELTFNFAIGYPF